MNILPQRSQWNIYRYSLKLTLCKITRTKMFTFLISSSVWISGERPPWTQRNCWFMRAASGRQSKASMQASYTRSVYLILPAQGEGNYWDTAKACIHICLKTISPAIQFSPSHYILLYLLTALFAFIPPPPILQIVNPQRGISPF